MGVIDLEYGVMEGEILKGSKKREFKTLPLSEFEKFNQSLLDLGDISEVGRNINAIAAIFDLEDFTSFCSQVDSYLVIPKYLSCFLTWLFNKLKETQKKEILDNVVVLYGFLPFYAKFLGDGILFLWNTSHVHKNALFQVVVRLEWICNQYKTDFFPTIKNIPYAPTKLRCGVAQGIVTSIGNGNDFVGSCINIASRLQKTLTLSFAASIKGIDFEEIYPESLKDYTLMKINIRGIGEGEFIYILKKEYDSLEPDDKKRLEEP